MECESLKDLIEAARTGDGAALKFILDSYGRQIRRAVGRRMGPALRARADSEDVLQTAMISALAGLADLQFRGEAAFVAWLTGIAEQEVARLIRRHRAECRDISRESRLSPGRPLRSKQTTVPQAAMRKERHARLRDAIEALPSPDCEVVFLRSFEGLGFGDIAKRLDLSDEHATRYIYRRALRTMGRTLAGEGLDEEL